MNINRLSLCGVAVVAVLVLLGGCTQSVPEDPAALESIIADVEKGWETSDGKYFRKHFLDYPKAPYVSSGVITRGLRILIARDVDDVDRVVGSLEDLDVAYSSIETHFEGSFAWALAKVEIKANNTNTGRALHLRGYQTFLFRNVEGEWKVVHTNTSFRR